MFKHSGTSADRRIKNRLKKANRQLSEGDMVGSLATLSTALGNIETLYTVFVNSGNIREAQDWLKLAEMLDKRIEGVVEILRESSKDLEEEIKKINEDLGKAGAQS